MLELHSYFEKLKFCKDMEMGCAEKERRVFEWRPKVTTLMRNDYMLAVRMERWKWIQDILEINRTGDWMKKREWKLRKKSSFLNWPQVRMVVSLVEYKQRESGMSNRTDFFFQIVSSIFIEKSGFYQSLIRPPFQASSNAKRILTVNEYKFPLSPACVLCV